MGWIVRSERDLYRDKWVHLTSADVELPEPAGGGQIVLACAPDDVERLGSKGLQRIGVVR